MYFKNAFKTVLLLLYLACMGDCIYEEMSFESKENDSNEVVQNVVSLQQDEHFNEYCEIENLELSNLDFNQCQSTLIAYEDLVAAYNFVHYCQPFKALNGSENEMQEIDERNKSTKNDYESFQNRCGSGYIKSIPSFSMNAMTSKVTYNCLTCKVLDAIISKSKGSTNDGIQEQDLDYIWLIQFKSYYTFNEKQFESWKEIVGSEVNQIFKGQNGQRYMLLMADYNNINRFKEAQKHIIERFQPLIPQFKVSPKLLLASAQLAKNEKQEKRKKEKRGKNSFSTEKSLVLDLQFLPKVVASSKKKDFHEENKYPSDIPFSDLVPEVPLRKKKKNIQEKLVYNDHLDTLENICSLHTKRISKDIYCEVRSTNKYITQGRYIVALKSFTRNNLHQIFDGKEKEQILYFLALDIAKRIPSLYYVSEHVNLQLMNNEASYIVQSGTTSDNSGSTLFWENGLTGKGVVVGVADSGLDYYSCYFYDASIQMTFETEDDVELGGSFPVFSSSNHRKIKEYFAYVDDNEGEESGHGTHVVGSLLGYPNNQDPEASFDYKGMSYESKVAFFDIGEAGGEYLWVPDTVNSISAMFDRTYNLGGRIHSNSWGSSENSYTLYSNAFDTYTYHNQDFLILIAAGNDGNDEYTVGEPATAKNSVAVGATDNHVASPDVAWFSSRGPSNFIGNPLKPDVCSPGFYVYSANANENPEKGHCEVVGMAGTSMATPITAGVAALVWQYFWQGYYPLGKKNSGEGFVPMAALIKAILINAGTDMSGDEATYHGTGFPNYDQGYGLLNLYNTLYLKDTQSRGLFVDGSYGTKDCNDCPSFSQSGEVKIYNIVPTANDEAIKITLVWHDYPAPASIINIRNILQNNLNLWATHNGQTFYSNEGLFNSPSKTADQYNTVEQVIISPSSINIGENIEINVYAEDIIYDPQPFSIVVTGIFRKDSTLYPYAVPIVSNLYTDNTNNQILLFGTNLPLSTVAEYKVACGTTSGSTSTTNEISTADISVAGYSLNGEYLALNLNDMSTTCSSASFYNISVTSDSFIGESFVFSSDQSINSTTCSSVANDPVCSSITICSTGNVCTYVAGTSPTPAPTPFWNYTDRDDDKIQDVNDDELLFDPYQNFQTSLMITFIYLIILISIVLSVFIFICRKQVLKERENILFPGIIFYPRRPPTLQASTFMNNPIVQNGQYHALTPVQFADLSEREQQVYIINQRAMFPATAEPPVGVQQNPNVMPRQSYVHAGHVSSPSNSPQRNMRNMYATGLELTSTKSAMV